MEKTTYKTTGVFVVTTQLFINGNEKTTRLITNLNDFTTETVIFVIPVYPFVLKSQLCPNSVRTIT